MLTLKGSLNDTYGRWLRILVRRVQHDEALKPDAYVYGAIAGSLPMAIEAGPPIRCSTSPKKAKLPQQAS